MLKRKEKWDYGKDLYGKEWKGKERGKRKGKEGNGRKIKMIR